MTRALLILLLLAACDTVASRDAAPAATQDRPAPDARGVISYPTYQVMVARPGDSLPDMAARVNLDPSVLARLNGLPLGHRLRPGEVIVLPDSVAPAPPPEIEVAAAPAEPAPSGEVEEQPLEELAAAAIERAEPTPARPRQRVAPEPIRHIVEPGETAFSIARQYGISVTALAEWNGLGPDLELRNGQVLLIPPVAEGAAPAPTVSAPGTPTPVPPPPEADAPLPEDTELTLPESPRLSEQRTPPGAQRFLARPVDAEIASPFTRASGGVEFAAAAGAPVRAAEDGEVALVSESLGGLGTIVLIRHADNLLTVYGRLTEVTVERGNRVARGSQIARVAEGDPQQFHFEVRRGTDSVDPLPYFGPDE